MKCLEARVVRPCVCGDDRRFELSGPSVHFTLFAVLQPGPASGRLRPVVSGRTRQNERRQSAVQPTLNLRWSGAESGHLR